VKKFNLYLEIKMASELDREWYDADEGGISSRTFDLHEYNVKEEHVFKAKEERYRQEQAKLGLSSSGRINPYKRMKNADQEAWEASRLKSMGLHDKSERDLVFNTDDDEKVIVSVRKTLPPFLDGRTIYTKQQEPVSVVKDPTSDIAVLAKTGSAVVRNIKMEQDRTKMRDRFWEVAGTRLGDVLGMNSPVPQSGEGETDGSRNFSDLIQNAPKSESELIARQKRSLPIYQCKSELMRIIRENQIVVVVGMTGSGKTTQLGQYLYEEGYHKRGGLIGCTQPRRVAAVSVAKRVADEMNVKLGSDIVGYSIRFEDVTNEKTKIKFMTDGVLLREALNDPELEKYSVIIMDEAHERSINTDILFGVMKRVASERSDFKLIVTSATMDSEKFSNYFKGAPVYTIPGRTFPVETFFSKINAKDYVESAVDQALSVHISQGPGDILIFMTGQDDIEATCILLADRVEQLMSSENTALQPLTILPIYSQLPADLQAKIFQPSPYRKVVVATNIAETSLTIDGIKYVIDTGFSKLKVYNPKIGIDTLFITPISRANADQRKGRAGRQSPGICWRLYTEQTFFYHLLDNNIPEIQRTNLSNVVLLLKSLGIKNLLEFDFMDPPPQSTILNSMHQLWLLEALDDAGNLTEIGKQMSLFPLDPSLSKMIISGQFFACTDEMISIVSMLTVPSIFYRPKDKSQEADAVREKFFVPESDHLTLLNVYEQYVKNGRSSIWCSRNYIHIKAMKKVDEIRQQILDIIRSADHKTLSSIGGMSGDIETVRKAIAISYFHNIGKLRGIGEYVNMLTSVPCHLHPTSALYGLGHTPEHIVYHEVVKTTKEYMQCVTAIDPEWLGSYGSKFFSLKYSARPESKHDINRQIETTQDYSHQSKPIPDTPSVNLVGVADTLLISRRKPVVANPITTRNDGDSSDSDAASRRRRNRKR
jgi:pre-mRNA-splicing factor ATP-dependent RNA helicase DHX38/PRP16